MKFQTSSLIFEKIQQGQLSQEQGLELLSALKQDTIADATSAAKSSASTISAEPIAIIGIAGQYPKAPDLASFWHNLQQGVDCIEPLPEGRWASLSHYQNNSKTDPFTHLTGGFLAHGLDFDARFFSISPREAQMMDPQERLFLMTVWHTLEDAGYTRQTLAMSSNDTDNFAQQSANVGVFVGVMWSEYGHVAVEQALLAKPVAVSSSPASIANRISYSLNLHGPSIAIDSQCSSSLSALHQGILSLRQGDCAMALVGGVNLSVHANKFYQLSSGNFLSAKGKCHSFADNADGIAIGEGVGCILIKPLAKAEQDKDKIHAVISATSLNHGAKTNGYTVPNPKAQQKLIYETITKANVDVADIGYIEAHGTGTSLGDPIEVRGLTAAFKQIYTAGALSSPLSSQYCALGSVKANIGHCESAAGMAGLTKILLQFKHQTLVPSIHSSELNRKIDFANSPFYVVQNTKHWPGLDVEGPTGERIAGLSSFGAGGANAHVLLKSYQQRQLDPVPASKAYVVVLSAANSKQLQSLSQSYHRFIGDYDASQRDNLLATIAYSSQLYREALACRLAVVCQSIDHLSAMLAEFNQLDFVNDLTDTQLLTLKQQGIYLSVMQADGLSPLPQPFMPFEASFSDKSGVDLDVEQWQHLAQSFVAGENIDWASLYSNDQSKRCLNSYARVDLPHYPFDLQTYSLSTVADISAQNKAQTLSKSKSQSQSKLASQLTSQLDWQFEQGQLTVVIDASATMLQHHQLALSSDTQPATNQMVLAGMGYLALLAVGLDYLEQTGQGPLPSVSCVDVDYRQLMWLQPLVIDGPQLQLSFVFSGDDDRMWQVQFVGQNGQRHGQVTLVLAQKHHSIDSGNFSEGMADVMAEGMAEGMAEVINNTCQQAPMIADATEFYQQMADKGLHYGEHYQTIEQLWLDSQAKWPVVARLNVERSKVASNDLSANLTAIFDGALQAITPLYQSLCAANGQVASVNLPYSISDCQLLVSVEQITSAAQVYMLAQGINGSLSDYLIYLCDQQGRLLCRINGFVIRPIERPVTQLQATATNSSGDHWDIAYQPSFIPCLNDGLYQAQVALKKVVIHSQKPQGIELQLVEKLKQLPQVKCYSIDTWQAQNHAAEQCQLVVTFSLSQSLETHQKIMLDLLSLCREISFKESQQSWQLQVLTQGALTVAGEAVNPTAAGVSGFCQALSKEIATHSGQVCHLDLPLDELDGQISDEQLALWLDLNQKLLSLDMQCPDKHSPDKHSPDKHSPDKHSLDLQVVWALRDGIFYHRASHLISPQFLQSVQQQSVIATNGVYVIIGGSGGLGQGFTEHLINSYQAQVVWLGRKALNHQISEQIAQFGQALSYYQCDLNEQNSVNEVFAAIKGQFGKINGIIHSALVLADTKVANMSDEQLLKAYQVKSNGIIALHQALQALDLIASLDWLCIFSSAQGLDTGPGQANYGGASSFIDSYGAYLRQSGIHTLVINWGYWGEIGIVATDTIRNQMASMGIGSLNLTQGIAAFEQALAKNLQQVVISQLSQGARAKLKINSDKQIQLLSKQSVIATPLVSVDKAQAKLDAEQIDASQSAPKFAVDDMAHCIVALQLQCLGWSFDSEAQTITQLAQQLGISQKYLRWFSEIIRAFTAKGLLVKTVETTDVVTKFAWAKDFNDWLFEGMLPINSVEPRLRHLDLAVNGIKAQDVASIVAQFKQQISEQWPDFSAQVNLLSDCLVDLNAIISGKTLATDVMFPNGSMTKVEGIYKHNPVADYFNLQLAEQLLSYIQLADSQQANIKKVQGNAKPIRLLEIGAGTGGTSAVVFKHLAEHLNQQQLQQLDYVYSDISPSFLQHGKTHYQSIAPYMQTALFDVTKAISDAPDCIDIGQFDVVIATNVLHATADIGHTMRQVNACLASGGVLLLNEVSTNELYLSLTFGLTDGWWLYDDKPLRIDGSPGLAPSKWRRVLLDSGFTDVDFACEFAHHLGQQLVLARAGDRAMETVKVTQSEKKAEPAPPIQSQQLKQPQQPQQAKSDVTPALERKLRAIIKQQTATALQLQVHEIIETKPLSDIGVDSIVGVELVSAINNQLGMTLNTTVIFDYPTVKRLVEHLIAEHYQHLVEHFDLAIESAVVEPKVNSRAAVANCVATSQASSQSRGQKVAQGKKVLIERPGKLSEVKLVERDFYAPTGGQIMVKVHSFALNFGDILCAKGLYPTMPPFPFTPGFEASGTVVRLADDLSQCDFAVGDEVVILADEALGIQSEYVNVNPQQLVPKPSRLDFAGACALPVVSLTMVEAFRRADLKPGETILIQTAAGGTGIVSMQLAKAIGGKVIATASSPEKLAFLRQLGADEVINYQQQDFATEVMRITNGRGVDVVINTLSDDAIQKGMNCLHERGRYVEIAMTALKSARQMDLSVLTDNQSFISVDLRKLSFVDKAYVDSLWQDFIQLVDLNVIEAPISQRFVIDQLHQAYGCLDNRGNIGKVVVDFVPEQAAAHHSKGLDIKAPATIVTNEQLSLQTRQILAGHPKGVAATTNTIAKGPIAIVGMSGQFGHAQDLEQFWQALEQGESLIEPVPESRWSMADKFDPSGKDANKAYAQWGSFLADVDKFDASFFAISGVEAKYMDPQQRLFLQQAWAVLEDGGLFGQDLDAARAGIYLGTTGGDYRSLVAQRVGPSADAQSFWGNAASVSAARLAYFLNFKGPAVAVDTACSSSLVAVHYSCQSLWQNETDLMLAGGIFIQSTEQFFMLSCRAGMLSPQGQCFTFDQRANGFAPGEGVGVLALKRLDDAKRDKDYIHGVILGSGINQDGTTNGITSPSVVSQRDLELEVYQQFNIDASTISYVEAHGTGTELGDPIEFDALCQAFSKNAAKYGKTPKLNGCGLGSVKTNIGHTAAAAGVAGIIKLLLSMRHGKLAQSLNYQHTNPKINLKDSPFYICDQLQDWSVDGPRVGAVSSFGFSGTNAHIVISEYQDNAFVDSQQATGELRGEYILPLSAKTKQSLLQQAKDLHQYISRYPQLNCADIAYSYQLGRQLMNERLAIIYYDKDSLLATLAQVIATDLSDEAQATSEGYFYGQVGHSHQLLGVFDDDEDAYELVERWLDKGKVKKLAQLWAKGLDMDWRALHKSSKQLAKRIPLPTYPFAKTRYWVDEQQPRKPQLGNGSSDSWLAQLDLAQSLTLASQGQGLCFNVNIDSNHPLWTEHQVMDQAVLPGVTMIEAALQLARQLQGAKPEKLVDIQLEQLHWLQPLICDDTCGDTCDDKSTAQLQLKVNANEFVWQHQGQAPAKSQGQKSTTVLGQGKYRQLAPSQIQTLGIAELKSQLNRHWQFDNLAEAEQGFYQPLSQAGIGYGDHFKTIRALYVKDNCLLSEVEVDFDDQLICGVNLLDSAMQAASLMVKQLVDDNGSIYMPFAVKQLKVATSALAQLPAAKQRFYILVTTASMSGSNDSFDFNLAISDAAGKVLITFNHYQVRRAKIAAQQTAQSGSPADKYHYQQRWLPKPLTVSNKTDNCQAVVILSNNQQQLALQLPLVRALSVYHQPLEIWLVAAQDNGDKSEEIDQQLKGLNHKVIALQSTEKVTQLLKPFAANKLGIYCLLGVNDFTEQQLTANSKLLALNYHYLGVMLDILQGLAQADVIELTMIGTNAQQVLGRKTNCFAAQLFGLAVSSAQALGDANVDSDVQIRNLDVDVAEIKDSLYLPALVEQIVAEPFSHSGEVVVLHNNRRLIRHIEAQGRVYRDSQMDEKQLKSSGVYVIVGGAGVVGGILTKMLVKHYQAKVVWLGRRDKSDCHSALDKIQSQLISGGSVEYKRCDVSDLAAFEQCLLEIETQYGGINGLIHSAIDFAPQNFAAIEFTAIQASLKAKIDGAMNCYLALEKLKHRVDFVCYCSSIQSFAFLPANQTTAYCVGIQFTDAFAHQMRQMQQQIANGVQIFTINWGYWADSFDHEFNGALKYSGFEPLSADMGAQAFEDVINYQQHQSIVMGLLPHYQAPQPQETPVDLAVRHLCVQASESSPVDSRLICQQSKQLGFGQIDVDNLLADNRASTQAIVEQVIAMTRAQVGGLGSMAVIEDKYQGLMDTLALDILDKPRSQFDDSCFAQLPSECLTEQQLKQNFEALEQQFPAQFAQLQLLRPCITQLGDILQGKVAATEVLFARSSMEKVAGVYKNNPVADLFNLALSQSVQLWVKETLKHSAKQKIRILEIGAGTGGASAGIFALLQPYAEHLSYCYTDLSPGFLHYAEQQYGAIAPYMETKILDIEQPLAPQGIELGSFDLVIAANVLHATKDMTVTLQQVKSALKQGGGLLLSELCRKHLLLTLTFGLTDGWWLACDAHLRLPGSPVLTQSTWCDLLTQLGFKHAQGLDSQLAQFGQQIIVAQSDGFIAQADKPKMATRVTAQQAHSQAAHSQVSHSKAVRPPKANNANVVEAIENQVEQIFIKALQLNDDGIDWQVSFSDYGMDSILSVTFATQISEHFGVEVTSADLFNYTNVSQLSEHLGQLDVNGTEATVAEERVVKDSVANLSCESIEQQLERVFIQALQLNDDEIDWQVSFSDYGMDSILSVTFATQISERFGVEVTSADLFNYTNISQLGEHLNRLGVDVTDANAVAAQNTGAQRANRHNETLSSVDAVEQLFTFDQPQMPPTAEQLHEQFNQGQISAEQLLELLAECDGFSRQSL